MTNLLMKLFRIKHMIILFLVKKIIFDNIIMAPIPASIEAVAISDTKQLEFTFVAYESSGGWVTGDVDRPQIILTASSFKKVINIPLYDKDDVPSGSSAGMINTTKITTPIDYDLQYGVDYTFTLYCVNGSFGNTKAHGKIVIPLPCPTPVLGTGTWASPKLKVNMTVGLAVTIMEATVHNIKSGTDEDITFAFTNTMVNDIRNNSYYEFDLDGEDVTGWTTPVKGDEIRIDLIASNGSDHSDQVSKSYDLYVKPDAPTEIIVTDFTVDSDDSLLVYKTQKKLTAKVTVGSTQVFDRIEILAHNNMGKFETVIQTVYYDLANAGVYDNIKLDVELGSVAKYAARVVAKVDRVDVKSDSKETTDFTIDKYNKPDPVLSVERLTSGYDAAHSADDYDLFEITLAAGVSSYDKRHINKIQVKAGDAAAFADLDTDPASATYMLPTAHTHGDNGGLWDVDNNGSAVFRVYTSKLGQGKSAQFQIATDQLKGFYTAYQQFVAGGSDAPATAQNMNAKVIQTGAIMIEYPLIAPNDPSNVVMTGLNAGVMVRWKRDSAAGAGGNDNNKATSFIVKIYGKEHFSVDEKALQEYETTDENAEYAIFDKLTNGHTYWSTVTAKNTNTAKTVINYSHAIRSAAGGTPLDHILGPLLTIESKSFTDPSCNFVVNMSTPSVKIATITIQEVHADGTDVGSSVSVDVDSDIAVNNTTLTINADDTTSAFGTKYFHIFATSATVLAANGTPVTASNTPLLFVSIETGKKPTIGTMTFVPATSASGKKTTKVTAQIDNHRSTITGAFVIAIPDAPALGEDFYTDSGDMVIELTKGSAVSNSETIFNYTATLQYHIAKDDNNHDMAVVLAVNGLGKDQQNN
jgi:hypothetical protein